VKPRIATTALAAVLVAVAVTQQVSRAAAAAGLDPEMLPQHLTETGLYAADDRAVVASGVRRFLPQYPLWSDGMTKQRWVLLPKGASIDATSELAWDFSVGTKFWKEFSLNGRRIETRMSWKVSPTRWLMASYIWNDDGTDAVLAPPEGVPGVVEIAPGRRHSIPSRSDCTACHGSERTGPLGFNALQLSNDRDPNAIHGEPLAPGMLRLSDLVNQGALAPAPTHFITDPPRIRTSNPATRSVLGYLATNCMMCHNGGSDGTPLGPSLAMREMLDDADTAVRNLIDRPSAWQVAGAAEGHSVVVHPGSPDLSALFVRLRSRAPSSQMPPLGTVVRDQQAVDAIGRWISDLAR
jgi:mono/diheme cytochrome c family protein